MLLALIVTMKLVKLEKPKRRKARKLKKPRNTRKKKNKKPKMKIMMTKSLMPRKILKLRQRKLPHTKANFPDGKRE